MWIGYPRLLDNTAQRTSPMPDKEVNWGMVPPSRNRQNSLPSSMICKVCGKAVSKILSKPHHPGQL